VSFALTLTAYIIDRIFGEFNSIRHPVVVMGDYIQWFEKRFYKDNIFRGSLLTISLLLITYAIAYSIETIIMGWHYHHLAFFILGVIASTTIASKMLYDAINDIILHPENIKYLVSRDTEELSDSEINKAAIESYAENLSDGVIAPLFYLFLFGLKGAFVYKAINTLDSMVGYRNERYEKFGKCSAIVDDIANYIPARITALLITLLMGSRKALFNFYRYGKKHESPNAGHPISAMALAIGVQLGGDTSYFGKIKKKAPFGEGKREIEKSDIKKALSFRGRLDILLLFLLGVYLCITNNMVGT